MLYSGLQIALSLHHCIDHAAHLQAGKKAYPFDDFGTFIHSSIAHHGAGDISGWRSRAA
jgi:hypothetical protein